MSRITVGKRWPRSAPRGDSQAICSYCGVQWRRSQLVRDSEGLLVCPDEGTGRDQSELARLNAASSSAYASSRVSSSAAKIDTDDGSVTPIQRTTAEDI